MANDNVVRRGYEYTINIKNVSENIEDIKAMAEGLGDIRNKGKDIVLSFKMTDFNKNYAKIKEFVDRVNEAGHNITLIDVNGFKKEIKDIEGELANLKNVFSKGAYKKGVRSVDELFPGLDEKALRAKRDELLKIMGDLWGNKKGEEGKGPWKQSVDSARELLSTLERIHSINQALDDKKWNSVKGEGISSQNAENILAAFRAMGDVVGQRIKTALETDKVILEEMAQKGAEFNKVIEKSAKNAKETADELKEASDAVDKATAKSKKGKGGSGAGVGGGDIGGGSGTGVGKSGPIHITGSNNEIHSNAAAINVANSGEGHIIHDITAPVTITGGNISIGDNAFSGLDTKSLETAISMVEKIDQALEKAGTAAPAAKQKTNAKTKVTEPTVISKPVAIEVDHKQVTSSVEYAIGAAIAALNDSGSIPPVYSKLEVIPPKDEEINTIVGNITSAVSKHVVPIPLTTGEISEDKLASLSKLVAASSIKVNVDTTHLIKEVEDAAGIAIHAYNNTQDGSHEIIDVKAKVTVDKTGYEEGVKLDVDTTHLINEVEYAAGVAIRAYNNTHDGSHESVKINADIVLNNKDGEDGIKLYIDQKHLNDEVDYAAGVAIRAYNNTHDGSQELLKVKTNISLDENDDSNKIKVGFDQKQVNEELEYVCGVAIRAYNNSKDKSKDVPILEPSVDPKIVKKRIEDAVASMKKPPTVPINFKAVKGSIESLSPKFSSMAEKAFNKALKSSLKAQGQMIQDAFDTAKTKAKAKNVKEEAKQQKSDDAAKQREINKELKERAQLEKQILSIRDRVLKSISSKKSSIISEEDAEIVEKMRVSMEALSKDDLGKASTSFLKETLEEAKDISNTFDGIVSKNKELSKERKDAVKEEKEATKELKKQQTEVDKITQKYSALQKKFELMSQNRNIDVDAVTGYSESARLIENIESILNQSGGVGADKVTELNNLVAQLNESIKITEKNINQAEKAADKATRSTNTNLDHLKSYIGRILDSDPLRRVTEGNLQRNFAGTEAELNSLRQLRDEMLRFGEAIASTDTEIDKADFDRLKNQFDNLYGELQRLTKATFKVKPGVGFNTISEEDLQNIENAYNRIRELNGISQNINIQWSDKVSGNVHRLTGEFIDQDGAVKTLVYDYNALTGGLQQVSASEKSSIPFVERMTRLFKQRGEALVAYLGTFASFYRVMAEVRKGIEIVTLLDTNMTELRRVSGATRKELALFKDTVFETGREIGSTGDNIIKLAADYARLGYSLNEASELARASAMYMNVGFIEDANFAMESLTSTMKAYGMEASQVTEIVDKFNEVGKLLPLNGYIGQRVGTPETELRTNMLPRCA